jgi:hypothetical protein
MVPQSRPTILVCYGGNNVHLWKIETMKKIASDFADKEVV